MAALGKIVRVESGTEVAMRRFIKRFIKLLQSLPAEERDLFRLYRHRAQDKEIVGYNAAKAAASALIAELGEPSQVVSAEVGADADGWLLVLKTASQTSLSGTQHPSDYCGFSARCKESDESRKS